MRTWLLFAFGSIGCSAGTQVSDGGVPDAGDVEASVELERAAVRGTILPNAICADEGEFHIGDLTDKLVSKLDGAYVDCYVIPMGETFFVNAYAKRDDVDDSVAFKVSGFVNPDVAQTMVTVGIKRRTYDFSSRCVLEFRGLTEKGEPCTSGSRNLDGTLACSADPGMGIEEGKLWASVVCEGSTNCKNAVTFRFEGCRSR